MLSRPDKVRPLYEIVAGPARMSRSWSPEHPVALARDYGLAKRIDRSFLFILVTQTLMARGGGRCVSRKGLSVVVFAHGTHVARSAHRCLGLCEREAVHA